MSTMKCKIIDYVRTEDEVRTLIKNMMLRSIENIPYCLKKSAGPDL